MRPGLASGEQEALLSAQVVLSTTTSSADPDVTALPPFDLAVVDEAGQATQPNCWLPLLHARRAVLVGDPQQLAPTILSPQAAAGGLGASLMEAAMGAGTGGFAMLTTQYRMHAKVNSWASERFYDAQLQPHPSVASHLLHEIEGISQTEITGLTLVGIKVGGRTQLASGGAEERGVDGQIRNPTEASAAVAHAISLLRAGVPPWGVAIISPYAAQVGLLRRQLAEEAALAAPDDAAAQAAQLEVATVDSFQGREAEAIVLSLVRSNRERRVGFLDDDRRLNVAVTRARRHLAVVCDPETVASSPTAASLLDHVASEGEWMASAAAEELSGLSGVVRGTGGRARRGETV